MQQDFLDRYSREPGPFQRWPARVKLLLAAVVVLTAALTPGSFWPLAPRVSISLVHLSLLAMLIVVLVASRLPWSYVLTRVAAMLPFVFCLAISIPLSRRLEHGWELMAEVFLKAIISWTTVLLLVNTTPFDELLTALRRCGCPAALVVTLGLMYRYLFVLLDELQRMSRARSARSFRRSGLSLWKDLASLIGMVFLRSFERAERVHRAMLARGFTGDLRTLEQARETGPSR